VPSQGYRSELKGVGSGKQSQAKKLLLWPDVEIPYRLLQHEWVECGFSGVGQFIGIEAVRRRILGILNSFRQ
jgi:hypothetical protein